MAFLKRLTVHKYVKNHAIHRSKNSFIRDDDRATRLRFILRNIFLLLRIYHSERVNYLKEKKKKETRFTSNRKEIDCRNTFANDFYVMPNTIATCAHETMRTTPTLFSLPSLRFSLLPGSRFHGNRKIKERVHGRG